MRIAVALIVLSVFTLSARSQVIYTPIQYQFGHNTGNPYYYGGHDPRVFAAAESPQNTTQGQVYSDTMPFTNAAIYGYGPDDAHNEAVANMPRYFRKRDLLNGAIPAPDGALIVPADLIPVPTHEVVRSTHTASPIIIIPKRLLTPTPSAQMTLAKAN